MDRITCMVTLEGNKSGSTQVMMVVRIGSNKSLRYQKAINGKENVDKYDSGITGPIKGPT